MQDPYDFYYGYQNESIVHNEQSIDVIKADVFWNLHEDIFREINVKHIENEIKENLR